MTNFSIQRGLVATGLAFVFALPFGACSSKKTEAPNPTGSISGASSPASAIVSVKATGASGQVATANSDRFGTGTFLLKDLKADVYTLEFSTSSSYAEPPSRRVTVVAGQTADAGTVICQPQAPALDPVTGEFSDSRGGGTYQARGSYSSARLIGQVLTINIAPFSSCRNLTLTLSPFTGPGTYPINGTTTTATYGISCPIGIGFVATRGSIVVSQFNTATSKVVGAFSFDASTPGGGTPQTITVSSGRFDLNYY